ncbi:hypothetical protein KL86APRO_10014 [uncultured Alphaproteobacteria bacterium]|uniref:Uncharacterized protein n=1 Tax=uncultured Alphaproteobacteria bacterium TaxID=91750 RepID=A0A212ITN6_9PROT|nr:hypothetical protein KL86APRO_10014 [uncultured Alphaproteobacteria bacterium]
MRHLVRRGPLGAPHWLDRIERLQATQAQKSEDTKDDRTGKPEGRRDLAARPALTAKRSNLPDNLRGGATEDDAGAMSGPVSRSSPRSGSARSICARRARCSLSGGLFERGLRAGSEWAALGSGNSAQK